MKIHRIVIGSKPRRLVRHAARELAQYTKQLFKHQPRIVASQRKATGITVVLDLKADGLSDQGYAFRWIDRNTFAIEGGAPIAVLWGVYDLVERWGVRYQLQGDILPDRPAALAFPKKTTRCEPDLTIRTFRTYNDFANNECAWSAEDYGLLIDQLAKLRYNGILFCVRPFDPFIDLRFHGARKTLAEPNFGWRPEIKQDHPGYHLFAASGDAKHGVFVNPQLTRQGSYDQRIKAGQAYARKVFRMAHARGMQCLVSGAAADFDPAIRQRIRELTKPQHKTKRTPIHRIGYGIWREGPDAETGRCMSVRNPVFLDAVLTNLQAHIDAFSEADAFFFSSTEFGGSSGDCERAWRILDKKYGLSKVMTLKTLQKEAARHAEGKEAVSDAEGKKAIADRAVHEVRGDIVILYALDHLINERGLDLSKARRGTTVSPYGLSAELHRFLPLVFPHGSRYVAAYGYMPFYVAKRTDTLKQEDPEAIQYSIVVSAEDDNIGLLPQLTGPSVHKIIEGVRNVGARGFQTRQWQHSNLLPTFHYLAHTAWEKGWTPHKAYRHLYEPVCGQRAMPHIMRAFRRMEQVTEQMHRDVFCVSFPVPGWICGFWEDIPDRSKRSKRLDEIAKVYEKISDDLAQAIRVSRAAGRDNLIALERHTRHAVYYCQSVSHLFRARSADLEATAAQGSGSFDDLDAGRSAVIRHLDQSEALMRKACETFSEGVRDRCDLGALATLNSYNLDVIAAYARIGRAKGEMFSCQDR